MAVIVIEGCVLRSMDYRESDKILSVLSGEHGRVDVIARGAKKSFRRFGGHLELFNHIQATIDHKAERDLHPLRNAHALDTFPGIQENLLRFAAASYLGELVLRSAVAGENEPRILQLMLVFLREISQGISGGEELVLRMGETKLLALRGFLPDYTRCAVCACSLGSTTISVWRTEHDGAVACGSCRDKVGRVEPMEVALAQALHGMRSTPFSAAATLQITPSQARSSGLILRELEVALLGNELKSSAFLEQMLDPVS